MSRSARLSRGGHSGLPPVPLQVNTDRSFAVVGTVTVRAIQRVPDLVIIATSVKQARAS